MLPGITGSLFSGAFLERVLLPELTRTLGGDDRNGTFRRLHQWWRRAERSLGPASSARAVLDIAALPLVELLGYGLVDVEPHGDGFVGALGRQHAPIAVLRTTRWAADAEVAWRDSVRAGRLSGARWGFIFTGRSLRLVDASRTWSRRGLQFDFAPALLDERSITALWVLTRCEALAAAGGFSLLEQAIRRSDEHGLAVCASLGNGVLDALTALLTALDGARRPYKGRPGGDDTFQQAMTIVYRLLFLLFAEARDLVPTWHRVYRDAYTIEALCRRSIERPRARGLWTAVQAISRLAHAGCRAGDLQVTPFNGRLFSPRHTPLAEEARLPDEVAGRVVVALATAPGAHGRQRISYADLGVEQLGAVYERVLEYEPSRAGPVVLTRTSDERKATGSFYTPRAMTEFLVRRALHPLVTGRSAEQILELRVLDPAMGSGAFLVAACRYLAGAAERALIAQGEWVQDEQARGRRAELRRVVAQRCLYGVDLNPMAVQLARLSLWLTTLAGDRPLTFLDHHLACGDSLLGAGLTDLARQPPGARRGWGRGHGGALPLLVDDTAGPMASRVLPDRFRLSVEPGDTPTAVRDKERALAALTAPGTPLSRWKAAADLWCAGWFWRDGTLSPGLYGDVLASILDRQATLAERHRAEVTARVDAIAREHRFFHWDLEFPEVFFDHHGRRSPEGGFDAVVGNPPWDVLRGDSGDRAARDHGRTERQARLRLFRDAGIYRHQGAGHPNRYQLFLERALQLIRPGGRVALILPSGLATDQGSGPLRRALLDSVTVDRLLGFDNREAIFPIHRDVKFLLLSGTLGGATERLACCFGRSRVDWLEELPDAAADDPVEARPVVLSRSLLESWDRESLGFPLLAGTADLEILATLSALVPKLGDVDGWGAKFGRELNATEDRRHFQPRPGNTEARHGNTGARRGGARDLLTVIKGKHLEPFRVRREASSLAIASSVAATLLDPERTFGRHRLAYRDVASATNRLTLIAALLPPRVVSTHTVFCLKTRLGDASQYCLLALLNSLVANYLVRLHVNTHVTAALMARLPVPRPASDARPFRELARLARSLEKTGVEADQHAYVRINTIAAQLYGLTHSQYEHVVSTFPLLSQSLRHDCIRDHAQATEPRHGNTGTRR